MRLFDSIFLLFLFAGGARAFVFSCEEVKYKLINSNLQESTQYVCLVPEEGYTGAQALRKIYAQADKVSTSFEDLLSATCIERPGVGSWRIVADNPVNLDCTQEFSLIFTSYYPNITRPSDQWDTARLAGSSAVMVAARTGIILQNHVRCTGSGNVTVYTGAGSGVGEFRFVMKTWRCGEFPEWIVSFENVITVEADVDVIIDLGILRYDWDEQYTNYLDISPDDRVVVMASGRSDNLQNLHPERNTILIDPHASLSSADVQFTGVFDGRYGGYVDLSGEEQDGRWWSDWFNNGSVTKGNDIARKYKVTYVSQTIAPQDIWDNQDNFILEMTFSEYGESTTVAPTVGTQTVKTPTGEGDRYCGCALDKKFGMPDGWDSTEIWIDVVIILDTSAAMAQGFVDATTLIESFIGTDDGNVLTTDSKAPFYTRVGLIAMSDKADVLYNLNMTKFDKIKDKVQIKTGVPQINVMDAFYAAQQMLTDGRKDRLARQVIYYMTNSDPNSDLGGVEQFTSSDGIIIVNNFLEKGEVERPGLRKLASPGYYYDDIQDNYMETIQLFCKANCFCRNQTGQTPYAGSNPDLAVKASGGCLRATPAGVPFSKARDNCASNGGGLIASIHDDKKAAFVNQLMASSPSVSDYYWIGYSKSSTPDWTWEDKSTNPYDNWDADEPNTNSVSKCAYVDSTTPSLYWGAGNCNVGFPFVCEFAPCSAGNNNC
ncbi:hypothetical protein PENTCL1PPCAC_15010 [Pristionchus entomophagus]|uniref:C-type lectin domain-containing protein n=1 Tax=Pristionchus entomophagus TaxID=358040 RepID=A0AAV5TGE0_9BILA|nr:hypothetical protein PENTCL1PPCAC_15010 [Pristionchus entomophagus]